MYTAPKGLVNDNSQYPVIDDPVDEPAEHISIRALLDMGWERTPAMISDDGAVIYVLVGTNLGTRWLALRVD